MVSNTKKNKTNKINKTNKTKKNAKTCTTVAIIEKNATPITFRSFEEEYEKKMKVSLEKSNKNIQQELIKLFKAPFSPSKITPQNDFYTFINYSWLMDTTKSVMTEPQNKQYFVQIDDFRVVQDKVYKELIEIVKNYVKKEDSKKAKLINNMYKSLLNLDERSSMKHIRHIVEIYDSYILKDNVWKFLAHINDNEIVSWGCPLFWNVHADDKNAKIFNNFISFPELSLYDPLLYFGDDMNGDLTKEQITYKKSVKTHYLQYIDDIFDACLGKGHGLKSQDVFDVEYDILIAMGCDSVKKDSPNFYNLVKAEDALSKYGFDWEQFSQHLGYKKTPATFVCASLNYLKCICTLLKENWKTPKWKGYWLYIHFRQVIRFNKKLVLIHYNFNGKFIHGIPGQFPRDIYPVFGLSLAFNTFLTEEYVRNYQNDHHIQYVENMGKDLITVFKRIIRRNKWLSPKTLKYALLKLDHLNLMIARPKHLRDDPLLDYVDDDPWGNLKKITNWRTQKYIALEGEDVIDIPQVSWNAFKLIGKQAYIVNAFYTPTENSIYIPLAYLQKPFIDMEERGIEYNLSHLGTTLGHEMSHALDDTGSKYDYKGNLYNWWTDQDRKKFKQIQIDIINQYEKLYLDDGIIFDAAPSIGEDLADISGFAICQEYLRDFQDKNKDIVPIRSLSFQAFYVYFAMQQRQHILKAAVAAQLKQNPHPMDKYRANVPLSRSELFRSLYNVKKGDNMWWHSTDTIW